MAIDGWLQRARVNRNAPLDGDDEDDEVKIGPP
jgi:hypothetical protein